MAGEDGDMTSEERISTWLTALVDSPAAEAPISLSLFHASAESSPRIVRTWRIDDQAPPHALAQLATDIDQAGAADAEDLGGLQRYLLRAASKGKEIGSATLRYRPTEEAFGPADSEPPTERGLVAQAQRHSEFSVRTLVQAVSGMMESQQRIIQSQEAMIQAFNQRQMQMFEVMETLSTKKLEREIELEERSQLLQIEADKASQRGKDKHEFWMQAIDFLKNYGPPLLHHITKGSVGKTLAETMQDKLADVAELEEKMLEQLTEADLAKIKDRVPPELFEKLTQAWRSFHASKTAPGVATPGNDNGGQAGEQVLSLARTLHAALIAANIDGLMSPLASGQEWEALPAALQDRLADLSTVALREVPDLAGVVALTFARGLWEALAGIGLSRLTSLGDAIAAQRPWADLHPDVRLTLLKIVNRALVIADWPRGANARGVAEPPRPDARLA
jgi:hypothetical protein